MKRQRKQYSADFKAKIAIEAVKGQRTIQEIGAHYGIHLNQVTQWKKQLLESAADALSNAKARDGKADEQVEGGALSTGGRTPGVCVTHKQYGLSR